MKLFLKKILIFILFSLIISIILILSIPKDENNYLCEYNHKVELIEKTPQPRIIFIGGSNIAFGLDSQRIKDSLNVNVINLGLHAGIGIRFPLEDFLQYIQKGDVVVLQIEYKNYFGGENGEPETFLPLMIATNWRSYNKLNLNQWYNIVLGIPQVTMANFLRLTKYPTTKSFNKKENPKEFEYLKSGFNEYGDEISHYNYPSPQKITKNYTFNQNFIPWLSHMIEKYEQAGATIIMLPPVCITYYFNDTYKNEIGISLKQIHHPYIVEPITMTLDEQYMFNTNSHINKDGVRLNTNKIINILRNADIPR